MGDQFFSIPTYPPKIKRIHAKLWTAVSGHEISPAAGGGGVTNVKP